MMPDSPLDYIVAVAFDMLDSEFAVDAVDDDGDAAAVAAAADEASWTAVVDALCQVRSSGGRIWCCVTASKGADAGRKSSDKLEG